MLSPVPGLTHLKVLIPRPPLVDVAPPPPPPADGQQRRAESLVRIALETAFGMRPVPQLKAAQFATPVRLHVAARQRQGIRGPVRVDTLHLRADGEIFGTAVSAGRAHAFTARVAGRQLLSFRVL
jgi:hypothetical protein